MQFSLVLQFAVCDRFGMAVCGYRLNMIRHGISKVAVNPLSFSRQAYNYDLRTIFPRQEKKCDNKQ